MRLKPRLGDYGSDYPLRHAAPHLFWVKITILQSTDLSDIYVALILSNARS